MTAGHAAGLIVIPARWGSSRLPGKPLIPIAGRTLLSRVVEVARRAAALAGGLDVLVATDDERIERHAREIGCAAVMTSPAIASGSGRVHAAAALSGSTADILLNLQGDAPFTPPEAIGAVVTALRNHAEPVATPVVRLSWPALESLRAHKAATASSGTTCVVDGDGRALWFSKAIIPAIRNEEELRSRSPMSPVLQHVGVYGYRRDALRRFEEAPPAPYELIESLEQLRFLALGIPIRAVEVAAGVLAAGGIDTPEDVALAEAAIARHGDPAAA